MTFNPNANWTTAMGAATQRPVYFLRIDGLSTVDYSTGWVRLPLAVTKKRYMKLPKGGAGKVDVLEGTQTVSEIQCEILDVDDEITDLVCTEAAGAPLGTLINRLATLYGGYVDIDEGDYPAIFTGRITEISMNRDLTGYVFRIADATYGLDSVPIMQNATADLITTVRGNVCNVYGAILTGTFSTSDPDFPLDFVTSATATTSAPTGLTLDSAQIDTAEIKTSRDTWHPSTVVEFSFNEPVDGREFVQREIYKVFQAYPGLSGDGKLGLKFHTPPLPGSSPPSITETDDIVGVRSWRRVFADHINKFVYKGDYIVDGDDYRTVLYDIETSDDTTNQSDTSETIEYMVESQGLRTAYDGNGIAADMAGRLRLRYLTTPVEVQFDLNFKNRDLEQGDVVKVTHSHLPDLTNGTRGITDRLMTVVAIAPDFKRGVLKVTMVDGGDKNYGVVAPTGGVDYTSATANDKLTYTYVGAAADNKVGGGADTGYSML